MTLSTKLSPTFEVVVVFFAFATRNFNSCLQKEAIRAGKSELFDKIDKDLYEELLELYYSVLFGRILARMIHRLDNIPPLPSILSIDAEEKGEHIVRILNYVESAWDTENAPLGPEYLSTKALFAAECSKLELPVVESFFNLNFGIRLRIAGFSEDAVLLYKTKISFSNRFSDRRHLQRNREFLEDLVSNRKGRECTGVWQDHYGLNQQDQRSTKVRQIAGDKASVKEMRLEDSLILAAEWAWIRGVCSDEPVWHKASP